MRIVLHDFTDCTSGAAPMRKPGDASMMLMVPWKDGYKVDLAALKRAKKTDHGEAAFVRVGADNKSAVSPTFKPTGRLTHRLGSDGQEAPWAR